MSVRARATTLICIMAPQNSTLLYENAELTTELNHFSPIQKAIYHTDTIDTCSNSTTDNTTTDGSVYLHRNKSISKSKRIHYEQVENEIPIWICGKPRFVSGITNNTTCSDLIQALIDDELNSSTVDVTASRDLNDYVITEKWRDVEQALPGDTKILPIWMAWGSLQYEVKFKLKINKNKAGTKIAGDYSNDDGDAANHYDKRYKQDDRSKRSAIVAQLMKRLIEQGESIKYQLNILREKNDGDLNRLSSKTKGSKKYRNALLDSFLCDSLRLNTITLNDECIRDNDIDDIDGYDDSNQHNQVVMQATRGQMHESNIISPISNDELFLMIDDGSGTTNENDKNIHVEYRQYYLNKKLDLAIAAAKVSVSSKSTKSTAIAAKTSNHKSISRKLEFDARQQNCFNKRVIKNLCENINQRQKRNRRKMQSNRMQRNVNDDNNENTIYKEIDRLMLDLQRLTDHEETLLEQLSTKCERYRNQNNKYMTNLRLKLCIDEVQHNLDVYAKEIIENELELHEIQSNIQQKYDQLFKLTKKTELLNGGSSILESENATFNVTFSNEKSFII